MANIDINTTMGTLMDFDLAKKYICNFNNIEQLINRSLTPVKPDRQYKRRVIKKRWISFTYRAA